MELYIPLDQVRYKLAYEFCLLFYASNYLF